MVFLMIGKKLFSSRPVPVFEVKQLLKDRIDANEKGVELTYEQSMVQDYTKKFSKLAPSKSEKLFSDLKKIDGVSEVLAVKIADILPLDMEQISLLVPRSEKIEESKLNEALELVKKYSS